MHVVLMLLACAEPGPQDGPAALDTGQDPLAAYDAAATCGECHPTQYAEWRQSMHAYAARSPVFDAMAQKAYRDTAGGVGSFCVSCHSPFGEIQGLGGATVAADRDAMAIDGVSCDVCHTAVGHDSFVGNNQLEHDPEGPKQGPFGDTSGSGHMSEQSDFLTSPELCGSCHDVFMFPGLRIEQAYTEYLDSPARADGLRCQDCHMSTQPGVPAVRPMQPIAQEDGRTYPDRPHASHRFIGPDYSLLDDFPYPDDLDASAAAQAEQLEQIAALLAAAVRIRTVEGQVQGQSLALTVELESLTPGHRVPTGFTSERQLWVALRVEDADGAVVYQAGDLDGDGNLRDSHSLDVQEGHAELDLGLVNLQSDNIAVVRPVNSNGVVSDDPTGASTFQTEVAFPFDADFIQRNSLEPLERRPYTWTIDLAGHPGPYSVSASLRYRNLPPYVLQALQLEALVPRLQIFTIDQHQLELP